MANILLNGVGWIYIALTLNRVAVGVFFMLSGYHKLFNPQRHRELSEQLKELGVHAVGFNQWWVPTVEFAGGLAVVVGFLAPLAAVGLLVLIIVAIVTSGPQRIRLYKPIDQADRIDDWLYLPEVLYAFMLIVVVSAGAGPYSVDALISELVGKRGA
jgi:putative oxidoreductase